MEPKAPVACPCPEPYQSIPCPPSHFQKIHLTIILASMPGSPKWSPSLRFPHQNPVYTFPRPHTCYTPCLSHSYFDHLHNICWGVQNIKLLVYISPLPVTLALLGPNILLSTLFSNTLSLRSSLNVRSKFHTHTKITGKVMVLYILIFIFLVSKLEYKRFCTKW